MPSTNHPHVASADAYIAAVLSGEIPACKWVKLACKRQKKDLARAKSGWLYRFDPELAEAACSFVEILPHIKGDLAGEDIRLEPWQAFILCVAFGWVRISDGRRRFRRVYVEVPRGNGKSTFSSAVGLYMLAADGEHGAEIYSAATTRDQARIVFRDAQHMAKRCPALLNQLGVEVNAHNICVQETASKFEALSAEGSTLDGLNIHLAIIDELHAHKTRDVYDVLETGIGKRSQSMLWAITTAGSDRTGICYETREHLTRVLAGAHGAEDEALFGVIWSIDEKDDWTDPASWRKANPNWGVSVRPEVVEQLCAKARMLPAAQNNFKTKHLNVWVSVDAALYDVELWKKCADPSLTRESLAGWECLSGMDLANKNDIASRCDVFWRYRDDGQPEYAVKWCHYTNREAVDSSRNASYPGWEIEGHLVVSDGNSTGQSTIEGDFIEFAEAFGVKTLAMDRYEGDYLTERLQNAGIQVVTVPMNVGQLSKPTKELDTLMRERRIRHDGDPVAEWMLSNVVGHVDKNDNVFPHKDKPEKKIDGIIALLIALSVIMRQVDPGALISRSILEDGVVFV